MTDFSDGASAGLDTSSPNVARMYDYWLGGKDNFAADREAAERVVKISEGRVVRGVRLNRAFLGGAVRDALAPGSRLILSHLASDAFPERMAEAERVYEGASARLGARPRARILEFFDGFDLLHPGLTGPREWLDGGVRTDGERFAGLVGVGELR